MGWFRRNHLVPVPDVASLAELNAMVEVWDEQDDARRISTRPRTVGELFTAEAPLLKPLPTEIFETGRWFHPRVDRYAQVTVRTNRYSVPVRLIGRTVAVLLHASDLVVYEGKVESARHERLPGKGGSKLDLDHYLEALTRKPGALPGATALEQARTSGRFTPTHDAWWAAACKQHGDAAGTRALIEVLLLHRHLRHEHVLAGLTAALGVGAVNPDVVALEARKAADADTTTPTAGAGEEPPQGPSVASLTQRRLAELPPDTRPLPSVAAYDQLLRHAKTATEGNTS